MTTTTPETTEKLKNEKPSILRAILNIFKQMDDLFMFGFSKLFKGIIKESVNTAVGAGLSGGIGAVVSAAEGYDGLKEAYEAYYNTEESQRHTKILTGALIGACGGVGIGTSAASLCNDFILPLSGAQNFNVILCAALVAIYSIKLERNAYIFHQAKDQEQRAEKAYLRALEAYQHWKSQINTLETELYQQKIALKALGFDFNILTPKAAIYSIRFSAFNEATKNSLISKVKTYELLENKQFQLRHDYTEATRHLENCGEKLGSARAKRLEAEREVAFSCFEVSASLLIFASALLLTTGFVAATGAVSFGIIPTVLLFTGIALGTSTKIFEELDKRHEYSTSTRIRQWFVDQKNRIFQPKKQAIEITVPERYETLANNAIESSLQPEEGDTAHTNEGDDEAAQPQPYTPVSLTTSQATMYQPSSCHLQARAQIPQEPLRFAIST